jgi:hypothetical protein
MTGKKSKGGVASGDRAGLSQDQKSKRGRPVSEPFAEVLRDSEGYGGEGLVAVRAMGLAGRQPEMAQVPVLASRSAGTGLFFISRRDGCRLLRFCLVSNGGLAESVWLSMVRATPALVPSRKLARVDVSPALRIAIFDWKDFGITIRSIDWSSAVLRFDEREGWSYQQVRDVNCESMIWEI